MTVFHSADMRVVQGAKLCQLGLREMQFPAGVSDRLAERPEVRRGRGVQVPSITSDLRSFPWHLAQVFLSRGTALRLFSWSMCYPNPDPASLINLERTLRREFERLLLSHMSEMEQARAMERWELICEQRGWTPPSLLPAPPCELGPSL